MPLTYEDCTQDVLDMADTIMRRHYQDLTDAGLTIKYLFAVNPDVEGGALKFHGYPAAAIVKRNSYKDRVEGKTDCTITIDQSWWTSHSEAECKAVLDHELYHIIISRGKDGSVLTDDCGRPKVKMRLHDVQIGEFDDIVKRHKMNAVGAQMLVETERRWIQGGLSFSGDDRGDKSPAPKKRPPSRSSKDKLGDAIDDALDEAGLLAK